MPSVRKATAGVSVDGQIMLMSHWVAAMTRREP